MFDVIEFRCSCQMATLLVEVDVRLRSTVSKCSTLFNPNGIYVCTISTYMHLTVYSRVYVYWKVAHVLPLSGKHVVTMLKIASPRSRQPCCLSACVLVHASRLLAPKQPHIHCWSNDGRLLSLSVILRAVCS